VSDSLFDHFDATERKTIGELMAPVDTARMNAARKAAQKGIESAERNADPEWAYVAEVVIFRLPVGRTFLAEDLVPQIEAGGASTHDRKALGPAILKAARAGLIEKTGRFLPAATSHGQPKPEWRRS
jgi:hypothetical protein